VPPTHVHDYPPIPARHGGYSQEAFAQEARLNRTYMGRVERGQRNVGVVNLYRIAMALDMSLSELFAEVEARKGREGG
jgi:transcriptional regulator with XRE-family HTH domain